MVIIDYLQLLDTASWNTNSTREREIAAAQPFGKTARKGTRRARHPVVAVVAQNRGTNR